MFRTTNSDRSPICGLEMFGIKMFVTSCPKAGRYFYTGDFLMPQAHLYFLSDQYYRDFPDDKLNSSSIKFPTCPANNFCRRMG